jgi:hypothetical protein
MKVWVHCGPQGSNSLSRGRKGRHITSNWSLPSPLRSPRERAPAAARLSECQKIARRSPENRPLL